MQVLYELFVCDCHVKAYNFNDCTPVRKARAYLMPYTYNRVDTLELPWYALNCSGAIHTMKVQNAMKAIFHVSADLRLDTQGVYGYLTVHLFWKGMGIHHLSRDVISLGFGE